MDNFDLVLTPGLQTLAFRVASALINGIWASALEHLASSGESVLKSVSLVGDFILPSDEGSQALRRLDAVLAAPSVGLRKLTLDVSVDIDTPSAHDDEEDDEQEYVEKDVEAIERQWNDAFPSMFPAIHERFFSANCSVYGTTGVQDVHVVED